MTTPTLVPGPSILAQHLPAARLADDAHRGLVVGHPARGGGQSPVALRILAAAGPLFYRHGIRSVSADVVLAAAGVTKATFYRHFATKSDLVVAYLEVLIDAEQRALAALRAANPGRPGDVLRAYGLAVQHEACGPGFRGCPFLHAAAEHPDAGDPVRAAVTAHRTWLLAAATELLAELGVARPEPVALALVMLRDGAMVATDSTEVDAWQAPVEALFSAGRTLVRAALV